MHEKNNGPVYTVYLALTTTRSLFDEIHGMMLSLK